MKNLKLIEPSSLKNKLEVIKTKGVFKKFEKFVRNQFGKKVGSLEHRGLQFGVADSGHEIEIHYLTDSTSQIRFVLTFRKSEGKQALDTAIIDLIVEEAGKPYGKMITYDFEKEEFAITHSEEIQEDAESAWLDRETKGKAIFEYIEEDAEVISTQGIFDFCLPGGYKWCGQGCGYATGGGNLKNKIDGCCKIHDDCYRTYKTNRCENCDRTLMGCVMYYSNYVTDPAAAEAIWAVFNTKCNLIIV